jgi:hypothetical protein
MPVKNCSTAFNTLADNVLDNETPYLLQLIILTLLFDCEHFCVYKWTLTGACLGDG